MEVVEGFNQLLRYALDLLVRKRLVILENLKQLPLSIFSDDTELTVSLKSI